MRSQHSFSNVPSADIQRSSFNLSHPYKTTFDADYLVPICEPIDIIPGDTFNMKTHFYMRLATPLEPILDNLHFETFAFFVPYRLIWANHEKFHGAQDDPGDSIDYTIPTVGRSATGAWTNLGSLWDYFGLPLGLVPDDQTVSSLPWRAYFTIYNEWFRDENLVDRWPVDTGDGPNQLSTATQSGLSATQLHCLCLKRGKRFDYFTSALPWPQKGTAVALPIQGDAVVKTPGGAGTLLGVYDVANSGYRQIDTNAATADVSATINPTGIYADLATATAQATINDIRLAFQTQRLLERDARSGTRYVEALKAHWRVTSPDFRLQRPEFLGGGSSIVNITPVSQQSASPATPTSDDKLGKLAAVGTVAGTHSWNKSFVEHGVVIVLGNLRGDITYSQGISRYWGKQTRYDFYYPVLANIGEQSILNREIFADGTSADDDVFGYQERYAEYRYIPGRLSGLMRPDATGTLASWHLSEDFSILPTLSGAFITANTGTPLDRAIAVNTEPHMIADFYHEIKAARPLPLFGVPGNLDHF